MATASLDSLYVLRAERFCRMGISRRHIEKNPEGFKVDTLFMRGLISADVYLRYLKEYAAKLSRGEKPTQAVGVMKNGTLDYAWTDRREPDATPDFYLFRNWGMIPTLTLTEYAEWFPSLTAAEHERIRRGAEVRNAQDCIFVVDGIVYDSDECYIDALLGAIEEGGLP